MPEDRANVVVIGFEPWHGPGFDNDQRGGGARPPGVGAFAIQPVGAEPGIDPANPEDPFPPGAQGQTFSYSSCNLSGCTPRTFTTSFDTTGYNSANAGVVARQRRQLKALGVDAVLVDLTNGVQRYPANPPGNALWNMVQQSVPALYAGLSGTDRSDLKVVPLLGVLENADVSDEQHGFGKLLDDWYTLATVTYPGRSLHYEGKPLVVLFEAVETHAPTCQNAAVPCWQLAQDYLSTHRPSGVSDPSKSWLDFITVRHMGGLYDSQPGARGEGFPGTPTSRVVGPNAAVPSYWTWVDRFASGTSLAPSFAATASQVRVAQVEAFTAANAFGSASWGTETDPSGGLRANIAGTVVDDPLTNCYETRRGGFACNWGKPGNYPPDSTLRRVGGVWAFQRYMKLATALRPTFLLINQWNQFEQTDEGFDFLTTSSLEPATWGPDGLAGGGDVDPYAPYQMAQAEVAAYRASLTQGRLRNFSFRGGVVPGSGLIAGVVLPGGDWRLDVRGQGPALAPFLSDALPDPVLTAYDSTSAVLATNDDCDAAHKDACLSLTPGSGAYTATLETNDGQSGVALLEVDNTGTSGFINASARTFVDGSWAEGKPVLGFGVDSGSRRLLILGRGPSLPTIGLTPGLGDPSFTLYDASGPIAQSLRYDPTDPGFQGIDALRASAGAFPLAAGDAVLVVNVVAGGYTAPLDGTGSGHAMFELFDVTP